MSSKALITGGAGFIGSHLAECLREHDRKLILVDDLSTGRLSNVQHLIDPSGDTCTLIRARTSDALRDHPELLDDVEQIFHLAASVGVKLVADDPASMMENNVVETLALLRAASVRGKRVLIASTSEVYGRRNKMPLNEEDELVYGPTNSPRYGYAISKALDEHLALAHHTNGTLKALIVRLFNAIGLRQIGRWGMVIPRFIRAAVRNEDLIIYGDGRQTRCFCDVRDLVRAAVTLMDDGAHDGKVFNIGSDREISIRDLADLVIDLAGSRSAKRFVGFDEVYPRGFVDIERRVPDLTKLRRATGFKPDHDLEDTLSELIAAARNLEE